MPGEVEELALRRVAAEHGAWARERHVERVHPELAGHLRRRGVSDWRGLGEAKGDISKLKVSGALLPNVGLLLENLGLKSAEKQAILCKE